MRLYISMVSKSNIWWVSSFNSNCLPIWLSMHYTVQESNRSQEINKDCLAKYISVFSQIFGSTFWIPCAMITCLTILFWIDWASLEYLYSPLALVLSCYWFARIKADPCTYNPKLFFLVFTFTVWLFVKLLKSKFSQIKIKNVWIFPTILFLPGVMAILL